MQSRLILRLDGDELARAAEGSGGDEDPVLAIELTKEPASEATYKLVVTSGSDKEEYEGLTLRKGRNNIATKVNAASKLIKIEETGSVPEEL